MKLAYVTLLALVAAAGCAKPIPTDCPTKKHPYWFQPHCERATGAGSVDRESGAHQQPTLPAAAPKPPEKPPVKPHHPKKWEKHHG